MTITISDWVEAPKANEYADTITALIAAGPGKAVTLIVPIADKLKARTRFAAAANAAERTAKVKVSEAADAASWRYVFILTPKHAARRNAEREHAAKAAAEAAAEAEAAAIAAAEAEAAEAAAKAAAAKPRAPRAPRKA
jgi:hypothetical protein